MLLINDLRRHNEALVSELLTAAKAVVEGGWYVLGGHVAEFEKEFAAYCGVEHCVSVANGTDALELALRALGVGDGDHIATVANAGGYSTAAIHAVNAVPVYVDVDPESLLLSLEHLRSLIGADVKAIIVTHLYGRAAQVDDVMRLAVSYGIPVIEDCAQAHGAMIGGRRVGSVGAIGCFSFYPTKNLGALGDGGALTTNDDGIAGRLRMLRQYGWQSKYEISLPGGRNSRLDELQASFLRVKLPHLDRWNARRYEISRRYVDDIRHPLIRLPSIPPEGAYVGHLFVMRTPRRRELKEYLLAHGIMCDVHYPVPDYKQPAHASNFAGLVLPQTEAACAEVLTLPCFPEMTDAEVETVVSIIDGWAA